MSDNAAIWLVLAGTVIISLVTLKHRKHINRFDPFGQYLRSGGKMLPDYDEENSFVDKYSR